MSRKVIDSIVMQKSNSNYGLLVTLKSNPLYLGEVTRKYKPITLEDPFKKSEPEYLIDLILQATDFNQNGDEFTVIGDKEYKLSKADFKKVKALTLAQVNPIEDISRGIADAVLWFNGEHLEPQGGLVYTQVFNSVKAKLDSILNHEEVDSSFSAAIDKMNG